MNSRVPGLVAAALVLVLAVAAASGGAAETAKASSRTGNSTITRDGKTTAIGDGTQIQEGDIVRVPTDARLTVEYADGSTIAMVGPAGIRFGEITPKGRRLVLGSGVITEATIYGIAVEIQAPSPYDASVVLQNARAFARVSPGDRVSFQKIEGAFAKVWRDGKYTDLGDNAWTLNARDGSVSTQPPGAPGVQRPRGPSKGEAAGADGMRVVLGGRVIIYRPASDFTREDTAAGADGADTGGGGMKLTFNGADDAFGVIDIGRETTLFVGSGQSIEFDSNGDVVRFSGVSHGYGQLFSPIMWDEPIENAVDASPSYSNGR